MSNLVHLYHDGLKGHNQQPTSIAAAESVEPTAGKVAYKILHLIRWYGSNGRTDDELEIELRMRHQTVSASRRGLVLRGFVIDSGTTRPTSSGRMAIIWIAKKK